MNRSYDEAMRGIRHKGCIRHPKEMLVLIIKDGAYTPQCNGCKRDGLEVVLGEAPGRMLERGGQMIERGLATQEQRLASLSVQDVRTLLPVGKATDNEIRAFIRYCVATGANPWAKDIYLIKYAADAPAAIVLALNWYLQRAARNPLYESYESGVIVERGGSYQDVVGAVVFPGDNLFGGWCRVWKKGASHPFERRVTVQEYDRKQALWKTMRATMIEAVAIRQGVRRAFPSEFEGEQAESELPIVLEGEVEALPAPNPPIQDAQDGPPLPRTATVEAEAVEVPSQAPQTGSGGKPQGTIKTFMALWNYGLGLRTPAGEAVFKARAEMLKALGVNDEAQVTDLAAAAQKLAAMTKGH